MKKILLMLILTLGSIGGTFAANNSSSLDLNWDVHNAASNQQFYNIYVDAGQWYVEPHLHFAGHRPYIDAGSMHLSYNGPVSKLDVFETPISFFGHKLIEPAACKAEAAQALKALNEGKHVQMNIVGSLTGKPTSDIKCSVKILPDNK